MSDRMTLGEAFKIRPVVSATDFVLQLQSGVQDADATVGEYVVTDSLAAAFNQALDYVGSALEQARAQGIFIHGSFGSGKSHFMAVLDLILCGSGRARALPGLQQAIAAHQRLLGRRLLTVEYHLIGAKSLEDALFSGYLATIRREHPDHKLPVLHRSDALLSDAGRQLRRAPEAFLAELNAPSQTEGSGWGSFAGGWTQAGFAAAAAAPVGDPERSRLVSDLVATVSTASVIAGEWLDISDGLAVMAAHAKSLDYDGLVLFLDELVLWLAAHLANRDFVSTEGSKVAKLVETGTGVRDLPIISFVARQRELQAFLGESSGATGAERMAVGDTFRWWEGRFDKIVLESADLPKIAHKRLLEPAGPAAAARIVAAVQAVKANQGAWDTLLASEIDADESDFADVYPFSPALVDTLVALSSLLQRERTALKVMAELLAKGRDTLVIDDVIPVGDLYDAVVDSGSREVPLTDEVRHVFGVARKLYDDKLRPVLLSSHGLDEAAAATVDRDHSFARDDRLAKTLIIAALVPGVKALGHLTAGRLAALNHGTVRSRIPGNEASIVLTKVRGWAESIGEIEIGHGADPIVSVQLSGVDYDSVLERVAAEDNESTRRTLARTLLFEQLGASQDQSLMGAARFPFVWRGSKRTIEMSFGNIRDTVDLPDATFNAPGDSWRLVVDFPFDSAGHSPQDDLSRLDALREAGVVSRTVAWVPSFLTPARMDDLGKLARLNYLLGGTGSAAGGRFDEHAAHLPVEQRPTARQHLENLRSALRTKLIDALKQAYGVAAGNPADIDLTYGDVIPLVSLQPDLVLQRPVGADLRAAMGSLADQMLASQFPDHPRFEPGTTDVRTGDITSVLAHVRMALDHGGRLDPVEASKRSALRSMANPLECGRCYESHYVFDAQTFPWHNRFTKWAAADHVAGEVPVVSMRGWLARWGLSRRLENLLILSWALLDDKEFRLHGTPVAVDTVDTVRDEYVLCDPVLPDATVFTSAVERAAIVFGITVPDLCSAANVRRLGTQLREEAQSRRGSARELVNELSAHAMVLGLGGGPEVNRVRDARLSLDLVEQLADESDPLVAISALANAPLGTEPHPIGTSLSSAHNVVAAVRTAAWSVLDPTAALADGDRGARVPGDPQAAAIIERLRDAARQSQAHQSLENPLRVASDEAGKFLAGRAPKNLPPSPPVAPTPTGSTPRSASQPPTEPAQVGVRYQLDAIELADLSGDARANRLHGLLSGLEAQLADRLPANPDTRLHIEWWLE